MGFKMNKHSKIYIAGHSGMVGSAIFRKLKSSGYNNLIGKTSSELDLRNQTEVEKFFEIQNPEFVILAAGKVGGIGANSTYPAEFIYDNLQIQNNIIHQSYIHRVEKLLFLGSSCIYPKFAKQPIAEEALLSGPLEPSNEAYAIAKIAGIKLCKFYKKQYGCNFISAMPTNLYGKNDRFDLENGHVLPSLIKKFDDAKVNKSKEVIIWGTGTPQREFLYVDDLADACIFLMQNYNESQHINIGTGKDIPICELAKLIKKIVGFKGKIIFDKKKLDGTPRKVLDISKINKLGWSHKVKLGNGIEKTYRWYCSNSKK